MMETITLDDHGLHALIAAHPVTVEAYKTYLRAVGRAIPPPLTRPQSLSAPVPYISQVDALAYLRWLGSREGQPYRLPSMAELLELSVEATLGGVNRDVWSHTHDPLPELRGGLKAHYLCEWTGETETIVQSGDGARTRVLGSVFYPPWLREGPNATHAQAYLLASEGYSFITFRAARDL